MGLTCTTEPGSRGPWKWDVRVLVGSIGIGDPGERGQGGCYRVGQSVGIAGRAVLLVLKEKLLKVTLLLPQEGNPAGAQEIAVPRSLTEGARPWSQSRSSTDRGYCSAAKAHTSTFTFEGMTSLAACPQISLSPQPR